ncbi:MAG: 3'(2'),5'-bisphosphate nucleotidase CysQ [Deltaproteobacteria bacterium]|nr:3'(2'),5'-bisphosphate nucleotidase CysQ [Candidatus Anaeroferrophillus wilburensis]MBN2890063.1 3'(2'),5'-bisphosphate nucleotidase CysQ [Deltaproteobacteria bacterium]
MKDKEDYMELLLQKTCTIAKTAGAAIMAYYRSNYEVKNKAPDNPVTDADYAADRLLKEQLTALLPTAGWLSEESVDQPERLQKEQVWVVDPLDGTKEFILGIPEFAVSIGLVDNGQSVLGVIYNPATDELFAGSRGNGIVLNGKPMQTTSRTLLPGAAIDASRSECNRGEFTPFEDLLQITIVGSTAYKLARVAAGLCDASWSRGPKNEWDICAGVLLIDEAGGSCVDLNNTPFSFNRPKTLVNGFIADNGQLHEQIIAALAPHGAARTT